MDGQTSPLVVVQENPLVTELFFQYSIFGTEVVESFLLLAIHPAGKDEETELPGLQNERHEQGVR
ncbi:MAG: hypothetical protein H6822_08250 [Planctomycetaceae bacterium]|nr:hypothetical protein [Planctomycetales bacterium]MCB9922159.1 hypothetical protein [Planctomycetaceae bacterium]